MSQDLLVAIVALLLAVPFAVLWAVALRDVFLRPEWEFPVMASDIDPKFFWTLVVVLLSGIGALAYYLLVMRIRPRSR